MEDHFDAGSLREEDLLEVFDAHRDKIDGAALFHRHTSRSRSASIG